MKSLEYGLASVSEIDVVVAGVVTASVIILSFFSSTSNIFSFRVIYW